MNALRANLRAVTPANRYMGYMVVLIFTEHGKADLGKEITKSILLVCETGDVYSIRKILEVTDNIEENDNNNEDKGRLWR